jgi:hypothetical protein
MNEIFGTKPNKIKDITCFKFRQVGEIIMD